MQRRTFMSLGAGMAFSAPLFGNNIFIINAVEKPIWLLDWIKINDENLKNYKPLKVAVISHKYFGGYKNPAEIPNPQSTSGFVNRASTLYSCPESIHYQSVELLKEIEQAAQCMLKFQHSDGTIDLLETNFHSTPDTAFVLENMVPAYQFLQKTKNDKTKIALDLITQFLKNAGEALIVGGVHTPNHRWVVSAALAKLYEIFGDKRYLQRIEQWLAENIDIDPNGQYTEKSTNTYSPIVNRSLINMARILKKDTLYEPVRRNLAMTLYYVHPNGEVVTEASNRQDKGTIGNMAKYYYGYRYMALHDKNGEFAAMCQQIEATSTKAQLAGYLDYFLEDEGLWQSMPNSQALPTNYAKEFVHSGVVRIRRGNWDATILSNNAGFLTFQKGNAVLQGLRFASSFFGKGQFQAEKIEKTENGWVLYNKLEGPYYQPIAKKYIDKNGDWFRMPREKRPQSEIQYLESKVTIKETESGLAVQIDISGTENVPVTVELIFRVGGELLGVEKITEKAYSFSGENCSFVQGSDKIIIKNGRLEHKQFQLRGALPPMEAPTVYITGFTPFSHHLFLS